jgi:uncharacterized protein (TIGR03066 family)
LPAASRQRTTKEAKLRAILRAPELVQDLYRAGLLPQTLGVGFLLASAGLLCYALPSQGAPGNICPGSLRGGEPAMKTLGFALVACVLLFLPACSGGKNADKIVGTWEATKGEMPAGSTVEFTKDGKMKINIKAGGQTVSVEGTYKVDGDKLTTTGKGPDGKEKTETVKIKKLTDKELALEDDKGKTEEFKKK